MGNWRRQRGRNNNHHEMMQQATRSQTGKPPLANAKRSVPAWEKNFCSSVGSVPWWKVEEGKKSMDLCKNVAQWDDSAGEEAFKNAKARFWAKINGLPCDIPLPDPDIFLNRVDWDAEVDPELILDLERDPEACGEISKNEHVVILDTSILYGPYAGVGWGPEWEDVENSNNNDGGDMEKKPGHSDQDTGKPENKWEQNCNGWNDVSWGQEKKGSCNRNNNGFHHEITDYNKRNTENSWEQNNDGWNDEPWGREKNGSPNRCNNGFQHENTDYSRGNSKNPQEQSYGGWKDHYWGRENNGSWNRTNNIFRHKKTDHRNGRDRGRSDGDWRKRSEGLDGYAPGYNPSRFQREDHAENCRWRNGRGRSRGNFQHHSNSRSWMESF